MKTNEEEKKIDQEIKHRINLEKIAKGKSQFDKKIQTAISNLEKNNDFLTTEDFEEMQSKADTKGKFLKVLTYLIEETRTIEKLQSDNAIAEDNTHK